jgi:hypothetical protein
MRSITTRHYLYSKLQITYDQNHDLFSLFFLPRNLFPRTYYISHVNKSPPLAGTWYIINGSKVGPGLSCVHCATRSTANTLTVSKLRWFLPLLLASENPPSNCFGSLCHTNSSIRVRYTPTVVQLFQCIPSRLWNQKLQCHFLKLPCIMREKSRPHLEDSLLVS